MRVGVDLDGVVYNFAAEIRRTCSRLAGRDLPAVRSWLFWRDDWDMPEADFEIYYEFALHHDRLFASGKEYPGARQALRLLRAADAEIVVVTHREGQVARWQTLEWLSANEMPFDQIIFAGDKTNLPIDALIDDAPHNLEAARDAGEVAIRFRQPWNEQCDGFLTVSGWDDVVPMLLRL